ncbi:MAG: type II toxin-antitoxin system HicA family toxin [Candidatus Poribacteria bacterium]|nr:type II toxin-antitoxin system HicA family toxin [Candidatus Poribacteria bacterium]
MQGTLDAIFRGPDPIILKWWRLESFLITYGAKSIKGKESRVRFELNGTIVTLHRPHSQQEAHPYQVKDARRFLEEQR